MAMVGLGFGVSVICGSEASVIYPGVTFVPLSGETQAFNAHLVPDNDNPALRRFLSAARVQSRKASAGDDEPAKARSVAMNRSSIGAMSLTGSTAAPVSRAKASA